MHFPQLPLVFSYFLPLRHFCQKFLNRLLNKFFYTTKKQSLMTAYTMMLKEKYCDSLGVLTKEYPSFYQFRYFYRKTRNLQNFYISRDGLKNYQRNNRPLVGEGVQEFAPAVGTGMFDATVCDIYLVVCLAKSAMNYGRYSRMGQSILSPRRLF